MSAFILAVDSSTVDVSVALLDGDRVITASHRPATKGETGSLLDDIRRVIAEGNLTLAEISLYAVGLGPGNFTGLRISAAAIQALALPSGTPVIGICSADAIAEAVRRQLGDHPVVIIGDARRERLWLLEFPRAEESGNRPEPRVIAIAEVAPLLDTPRLVIATPDWSRIGPALEQVIPASATLIRENRLPDAADIGRLARERHQKGSPSGPIDPIYVHPPVFIAPVFREKPAHQLAPTP
jgi:tRNA threonylcarbamoyl adenosine modification protein YeaZ